LRQEEARRDIGGEHAVPVFRLPFDQRCPVHHPRIGDHDVEPAQVSDDRLHDRARHFLLGHIEHCGLDLEAAIPQLAGRGFQRVGVTAVEHHRGAGLGQRFGHREAETAGSAGDQRNASVERKQRRLGHAKSLVEIRWWLRSWRAIPP
jgi:hypothetical protein